MFSVANLSVDSMSFVVDVNQNQVEQFVHTGQRLKSIRKKETKNETVLVSKMLKHVMDEYKNMSTMRMQNEV